MCNNRNAQWKARKRKSGTCQLFLLEDTDPRNKPFICFGLSSFGKSNIVFAWSKVGHYIWIRIIKILLFCNDEWLVVGCMLGGKKCAVIGLGSCKEAKKMLFAKYYIRFSFRPWFMFDFISHKFLSAEWIFPGFAFQNQILAIYVYKLLVG